MAVHEPGKKVDKGNPQKTHEEWIKEESDGPEIKGKAEFKSKPGPRFVPYKKKD